MKFIKFINFILLKKRANQSFFLVLERKIKNERSCSGFRLPNFVKKWKNARFCILIGIHMSSLIYTYRVKKRTNVRVLTKKAAYTTCKKGEVMT